MIGVVAVIVSGLAFFGGLAFFVYRLSQEVNTRWARIMGLALAIFTIFVFGALILYSVKSISK